MKSSVARAAFAQQLILLDVIQIQAEDLGILGYTVVLL